MCIALFLEEKAIVHVLYFVKQTGSGRVYV